MRAQPGYISPDQTLEQDGGVLIGLLGQSVLARHHHALLEEVPHPRDHLHRVQVDGIPPGDVEDLLSVPDHPLQLAGQHNLGGAWGTNNC